MGLLEEHGSDAVRYWAAKGGPGVDTAFDAGQMQVGRRLAIKLLNASRFVLGKSEPVGPVTHPIDRGMLTKLAALVGDCTASMDEYDYTAALRETEAFFWWFCDDHIEHVKRRRAGDSADAASATASCLTALSVLLRLFAPFVPFVTEEIWSWWREGSVHRASWPTRGEKRSRPLGGARTRPHLRRSSRASEITALDPARAVTCERPRSVYRCSRCGCRCRQKASGRSSRPTCWPATTPARPAVSFGQDFAIEFAAPSSSASTPS